jgi:tRNA(fMet)-specific endonuclease VapC
MKGDAAVIERLQRVGKADVGVPQPVLAEIAYGMERLPASKQKEVLRLRFELIREEFPRVPWTDDVSESFGSIKASLEKMGRRIGDFDAAIAAHALAVEGVLVSANVGQMTRVSGLTVEDWAKR